MSTEKNLKYFRSEISGLTVATDPETAEDTRVRFTPVLQRWDGEMQKFGYLKSSNPVVLEVLATDPHVVEIDEQEYNTIMKKAADDAEVNVRLTA